MEKHQKQQTIWYDNTCRQLKKQLQHLAKKMNPATHRSLQQEYFALKKKYKKQVKLMHKKYKNVLINEINALSSENSQDVWRQINKLRKESTVEEETLISLEAWIQHFLDNYFLTAMKQMKIQILQMTRTKQKICHMMKS